MIPLLGFLDLGEVRVERLLIKERGAVKPLEHGAVGLPLPVRRGNGEQLERPHLAGVRDVRPPAKVDELPLSVEGEDAVLVQLLIDVLDLEILAQVLAELPGVGDRQREALKRLRERDDLLHFGLDGRKVVLGDRSRAGQVDVVVEAGGGGRAEGESSVGVQSKDGSRHHMRSRVSQDVERLGIPGREDTEGDRPALRGFERTIEIDDRSVGHGGDGGFGQPLTDGGGHFSRDDPIGELFDRTVRQLDLNHRNACPAGFRPVPWNDDDAPSDPQRRHGTSASTRINFRDTVD